LILNEQKTIQMTYQTQSEEIKLKPLKVIFIDWDGTLSKSRFWQHWLSKDPQSYNKIQQTLFTRNERMLQDWMRGYVSVERIVNKIAYMTGIDYQYLISELEESCKSMTLTYPRVLDIIKEKQDDGVKVVIATDNMDTFERWTVPSLKLDKHFAGILSSPKRGALKADVTEDGTSLFFDQYLTQNSIKPNESLLIDDRNISKVTEKWGMGFIQVTPLFSIIDALELV